MLFRRKPTSRSTELLHIVRNGEGSSEEHLAASSEAYFGFRESPFSLTPDTGFFFDQGTHQEALNVLLVALAAGDGFLKVVGEVGTGKTLLCRKLLSVLGGDYHTAYLHYPMLTPDGLRFALAEELGMSVPQDMDQHRLLKALHQKLLDMALANQRVLVCLDEAQCMPDETFEALRLLSNLETEKEKLFTVVLFGQPELDERLAGKTLRQLRTRIAFSHHLDSMDPETVRDYVRHRLRVAGDTTPDIRFTSRAMTILAAASRGVPRIVNILARKGLMAAWGQGVGQVEARHVRNAVLDSEEAHQPGLLSPGGLSFALARRVR